MIKILFAAIIICATFFLANQVSAKMYKWVDPEGVTHYDDAPSKSDIQSKIIKTPKYPPPRPKPTPEKIKLATESAQKKEIQKKATNKRKQIKKNTNTVEIYTTSWCRYCKDAIAFLKSNRIKYKQFDIEKDKKAAAKMRTAGGTGGVPFAIINGEKIYGFSVSRYKRVLGLH